MPCLQVLFSKLTPLEEHMCWCCSLFLGKARAHLRKLLGLGQPHADSECFLLQGNPSGADVCLPALRHNQGLNHYEHNCLMVSIQFVVFYPTTSFQLAPCDRQVLRMERLVSEGSLPVWFPHLAAAAYVVMVGMLELGHRFQTATRAQES